MEPIRVPAPPKQAFNKHRRMSDLIRKQVHHFKHLEQKLPDEVREQIPQHHVVTENDAAQYIAAMTKLLLSGEMKTTQAPPAGTARKGAANSETRGLSLVAAAETGSTRRSRSAGSAKKSAANSKKAAGERSRKGKKK